MYPSPQKCLVSSASKYKISGYSSLAAFSPALLGNIQVDEEIEMVQYQVSVQELGSLNVYDDQDEAVKLSSLWQDGTGVLVFVRHFG